MKHLLPEEHIAAVNRHRRVIVNFDVISGNSHDFAAMDIDELVKWKFMFADEEGTHIDSTWFSWGEGNQAPYPSKILPLYDSPGFKKWADAGINIAQVFLEKAKKRGLEAFFSYRINGSDNDLGPVSRIPMKEAHPDWLIHTWNENGYWNFAIQEVRNYKLSILREVAEDYDFDGIELDFARVCPVLTPGHQWENRDKLTDFMRETRSMLLEIERRRGRPFLLAARVPENLEGCHFDGLDVETWAREQLVDILVMGIRSFDVDILAFRRITAGTPIKLYSAIDDHHASDGYTYARIEVLRGVFANWWSQGADGIQTFNFNHATADAYARIGLKIMEGPSWETHRQLFHEMGDPESLKYKDKAFVVQRRGGGHGPTVVPNPEDWSTPRAMYFNTNMFAPLPATLDNYGKADTLLTLAVADDLAAQAEQLERITVRLLLSDPAAEGRPVAQRLEPVIVATQAHPSPLQNFPPERGIKEHIEVRINNILLGKAVVEGGWLAFEARPKLFAVGENLIGVRILRRPADAREPIAIEKLEVHIEYRQT